MRYLLLSFFLILSFAAHAQKVKIRGTVKNFTSDTISIKYNDSRLIYLPRDFTARLDKEGNFSTEITVPDGVYTQAELKQGRHIADVILQPGDNISVIVDAAHFDSTIHYSGKDSTIQNFIAKRTIERGRLNQYPLKIKPYLEKGYLEFEAGLKSEENKELKFITDNKEGLPTSFIKYLQAYYKYYNYFFLGQYPQSHELAILKRYTDTIPQENYRLIKDMPYAYNDSLIQVTPYLLYLTEVTEVKLRANGFNFPNEDTTRKLELEDSVVTRAYRMMPPATASYFIAQLIYARAKYQRINEIEKLLAQYKEHFPQSEYMPLLEKQVAMARSLSPGQPAPDMDIRSAEGAPMKLSDLKGKVVYLEFWAEWSRQSAGEMISEARWKPQLADKPVAFVYVSIGSDTLKDKALIKRYKINGYFANASGSWASKEATAYGVQQLPAYFLIDEEGKFAIQTPPTPGKSDVLITEIEKLIK